MINMQRELGHKEGEFGSAAGNPAAGAWARRLGRVGRYKDEKRN